MAELRETLIDPTDTAELAEWIREAARRINYELSFGDPIDTEMDGPNGRTGNLDGRWVRKTVSTFNTSTGVTAVTFTHNLEAVVTVETESGDKCNVLWPIVNARHDGTGTGATTPSVELEFVDGDTVTTNSVDLRVRASGRTCDATHPLELVVWFQKATPW